MTAHRAQPTPLDQVRVLQRKLYRAAKARPTRTFGVWYDKVCSEEVLDVAWNQVRRNRGAAGVDGEASGVGQFLCTLQEELRAHRYRPVPVRRVFIPKPDGQQPPLGIPRIRDRVVQAGGGSTCDRAAVRSQLSSRFVRVSPEAWGEAGDRGYPQVGDLRVRPGHRPRPEELRRHDRPCAAHAVGGPAGP